MRLLIVEDQKKMAGFLKQGLNEAGYAVDCVDTSEGAQEMTAANGYDLIVLDVMLPDKSGFDTARNIRAGGFAGPILMLTAMSGTKDKVSGLDAGADDYLTKPFAFEELLARIRALLRRQTPQESSVLRFADVEMDLINRTVARAGQKITLTTKEFSLLEYFLRHPNRPLSRTAISEHVWDVHFDSESNVIDVYINLLRKKVDAPFEQKLIHTVVGVGYVLKQE